MYGIAGLINLKEDIGGNVKIFSYMTDTLINRGADASGKVTYNGNCIINAPVPQQLLG